jgi:hypothetical protein
MSEDMLVRRAADRLVPPERDSFFEDFWLLAESRERAAARRWRRVALALAVVAFGSLTAAAVIAAPFRSTDVHDDTMVCDTLTQGGLKVFNVAANATRTKQQGWSPALMVSRLLLTTGGDPDYGTRLVGIADGTKGYIQNRELCKEVHSPLALGPRSLPLLDTLRPSDVWGRYHRCLLPGRLVIRSRVTTASSGVPKNARLGVELQKRHRPLFYVEWSPSRVKIWGVASCKTDDF